MQEKDKSQMENMMGKRGISQGKKHRLKWKMSHWWQIQLKNGQKIWTDVSPKQQISKNHDKRLNIINHYRKANQNHNEIPLYTHYDMIKRWITASVGICGDIGTPAHCWWEYIKWCSYYKNSLAVSQNVKCKGTAWPSNSIPRYIHTKREPKTFVHTKTCPHL